MNRIHQVLLALSMLTVTALAAAEPRIALVIGNGQYASGALPNPVNDAKLISDTLTGLGFDVVTRRDADQATMKRAIEDFGARLQRAGADAVGLFFYAGHGVQLNGHNYLIPTTAHIEREGDMEIEAVSADWIVDQMRYANNRMNLVILDACRNNPFKRGLRSLDRGLAVMDAPSGTVIAYSTAPGEVADDGNGRDSPYTFALAKAMRQDHEPVEQVFKHVRVSVLETTNGKQTPWEASSLTGDFYFSAAGRRSADDGKPDPDSWDNPSDTGGANSGSKRNAGKAPPSTVVKSAPSATPAAPPAPAPTAPAATPPQVTSAAPAPSSPSAPSANPDPRLLAQLPKIAWDFARRLPSEINTRSISVDDVCRHVVGRWRENGVPGVVIVESDHTLTYWRDTTAPSPAISGRWMCESGQSRRFVFTWNHGYTDTLILTRDERELIGSNQLGTRIVETRIQPLSRPLARLWPLDGARG